MAEDLPDLVTHFKADLSDLESGIARGEVMIRSFRDQARSDLGDAAAGGTLGKDLGDGLAQGLKNAEPAVRSAAETSGQDAGDSFGKGLLAKMYPQAGFGPAGEQIGKDVGDGISKGVEPGLKETDRKVKDQAKKTGQDAGAAAGSGFAGGMSPLILGGFALAATAGPPLILGALATGLLGVAALANKSNSDLAAGYAQLGQDAKTAITDATAPLVPSIRESLTVLDQGIGAIGPRLQGVFEAVAPSATQLTGGLVSLVSNTLPGMQAGLKDIAPYAHTIADDFGKLGNALGGFFAGIGQGAGGGTAGFDALMTTIEHLLPDLGRLVGDLSNGLGPALHAVESIAVPAANALADVADALPPGAVHATADAVGVLYAAFKIGTLTGAIEKGTTFLQQLSLTKTAAKETATEVEALGAAQEATAAKTGLMASASALGSKAMGGLGTAASVVAGPLGLIVGAAGLLGDELGNLSGVGHGVTLDMQAFASTLTQAADGGYIAQQNLNGMAATLDVAQNAIGNTGGALGQMDAALVQLYQADPAQAAKQFQALSDAFNKDGKSAQDVAGMFPQYTQAVKDANLASQQLGTGLADQQLVLANLQKALAAPAESFDTLSGAMTAASLGAQQNARQSAAATLAALGFADGESSLATQLDITLQSFTDDTTAAGGYKSALDALYGKYQSYSDAQATFTTDLDNAAKGLKASKEGFDETTTAGAANYRLMSTLATANENRAQALLAETGSQQQANKELQNGALAIDNMAKKAGFTKTQIDALNLALYGTKNIGDISVPISADTSQVYSQVDKVISWIGAQTAYVQVGASSGGAPGGKAYVYDDGGFVDAPLGAPVAATVHGQEYVLSAGMLAGTAPVDARVLASLRSAMGAGLGVSQGTGPVGAGGYGAAGAGGGGSVMVVAPVYLDGRLVGRSVTTGSRNQTQQFSRWNAISGFAGNYS